MAWYAPKVTTAPTEEPVTVDDVRGRCNIDSEDDDVVLTDVIIEARGHVEKYCNIRIGRQIVELKCDGFNDLCRLPVGPVRSVSTIAYVDIDGAPQTLADTVYEWRALDDLDLTVVLQPMQAWPSILSGSLVTVTVEAGFNAVPPPIRGALFIYIADKYENRENSTVEGVSAFDNLLCNFRRGA